MPDNEEFDDGRAFLRSDPSVLCSVHGRTTDEYASVGSTVVK